MLKKTAALFIMLLLTVSPCTFALAEPCLVGAVYDPRALESVLFEIQNAGASSALVETEPGKIVSVPVSGLIGAREQSGGVLLCFKNNGGVSCGLYAEPDIIRHMDAEVPGSLANGETDATDAGNEIGLDRLRELFGNNGNTVVVAVLDTGVDITRPELENRIVYPYDAVADDSFPQDKLSHGTHVAGIIAANTPENVKIMPVRIFSEEGDAPDSIIVRGIDYAVKHGADVVNLSLGGYGTTSYLEKAIEYADSSGVTIVVSAGNEATDLTHCYPAAFPKVITVGATGENGDLLYFSNTGDVVDVCAPGEKISSIIPDGGTKSKSGTSMAAPLVSSAAAMLLLEDPERTPADIEKIIQNNTYDLGAPGKDMLFGFGEASFGNYASDPDFYMLGSDRAAGREEKFTMNLSWFSGERVARTDIFIDGVKVREVQNLTPGYKRLALNIRDLAAGGHKLEIVPVLAGGEPLPSYKRDFLIPEFNIRVRVYTADNTLVPDPAVSVLGFSEEDKKVNRMNVSPVVTGGVWMVNLDYDQLYRTYGKIRFSVDPSQSDNPAGIPFYLRTIGTAGEKVFEPSECLVLGLTSKDQIPGCTVKTHILGKYLNGFDAVETWGSETYETGMASEDIPFVGIEGDAGEAEYAGLLYYDVAGLWLDVYSWSGGRPAEAGLDTDVWYYSGELIDVDSIIDLSSAHRVRIGTFTDITAAAPLEYILLNIPTGDSVTSSKAGRAGSMSVMPGIYDLFVLSKRTLKDGRVAQDGFFTSFYCKTEGSRMDFTFGRSLKDRFIYDDVKGMILHRWVDENDNGYTVVIRGSRGNDFCTPVLTLTDEKGKILKVRGQDVIDAGDYIHGYKLDAVPDGIYRAGFINKNEYLACPVAGDPLQDPITIRGGKVVYPGNTPPSAYSDRISDIRPGGLFVNDLTEEFRDREQHDLEYTASSGWIVDGMYFYRDLIGEDVDITITAYDGAGGSASFKHTIRISDKNAADGDYVPNPDIDSIGAANWAAPFVKNAISAGIVPVELLDSYQSNITRQEFSALIVKMAETLKGPIKPSPDVGFSDTRDENVLKAASAKFLTGSDGRFSPLEELSRQQFCVIVYQAMKVLRPDLCKTPSVSPKFRDADKIAPWAKEAVDFCAAGDLIVGSSGTLNPTGRLSRELAILMLYKAYVMCR